MGEWSSFGMVEGIGPNVLSGWVTVRPRPPRNTIQAPFVHNSPLEVLACALEPTVPKGGLPRRGGASPLASLQILSGLDAQAGSSGPGRCAANARAIASRPRSDRSSRTPVNGVSEALSLI